MLCSPSSFTITATRFISGRLSSRLMSVVLPLPKKPVTMLTGMRPASGSRSPLMTGPSDVHFEDVETACEAVHRVDNPALVDPHVVDLNRAGGRHFRCAGNVVRDFLRLIGVGRVVGANAAVEKRAYD